jgi:ParB family chromosome partitioning protein
MSGQQHKALGRGLGALLPGAGSAARDTGEPANDAVATRTDTTPAAVASQPDSRLPLTSIVPNPDQPRRTFDPAHLERMADSIRRHGVLQPIVVRRAGDHYELICGEQRWRAAGLAETEKIPAVVVDVDEQARLEMALIENVQRADLNPIELAHAFAALGSAGATHEQIGERVSLDRSTISNHLRLLELPRDFQADVEGGALSIGHAKALLQVRNPERRRQLRDRIIRDSLSVRAAEAQARATTEPKKPSARAKARDVDPNLQRLVDLLRRHLQTQVRINGDSQRGRVEIEYFGTEDLNRIASVLLGDA